LMAVRETVLPVGSMPMNSPWCVPEAVNRSATRSSSPTRACRSLCQSGNAFRIISAAIRISLTIGRHSDRWIMHHKIRRQVGVYDREITSREQSIDERTNDCLVVFYAHALIVSDTNHRHYPNLLGCAALVLAPEQGDTPQKTLLRGQDRAGRRLW